MTYLGVHNCIDTEDKSLLPSLCQREELPLFGKEGQGEIFRRACLLNYGLLSNCFQVSILLSKFHFPHSAIRKGAVMVNEKEGLSTAESLRKTRTYGQFRCHNPSCMGRLQPEPGVNQVKCPVCGLEFRVAWIQGGFPRIRGPVWDVNRKIAEEELAR